MHTWNSGTQCMYNAQGFIQCIEQYQNTPPTSQLDAKNVYIVYFAFLKPERWRHIVMPQMTDLKSSDLLQQGAHLHVVMSGEPKELEACESEVNKLLKNVTNKVQFTKTTKNLYEYPGIHMLYEKGRQYPEKIFLYFHSKGMVFYENDQRLLLEKLLTKKMVIGWKPILEVFQQNPQVAKVCLAPSPEGWCWYNFFWVRGKYFKGCNEPIISDNRYYYEDYLGRQCKVIEGDAYSMGDKSNKKTYDGDSVVKHTMSMLLN